MCLRITEVIAVSHNYDMYCQIWLLCSYTHLPEL